MNSPDLPTPDDDLTDLDVDLDAADDIAGGTSLKSLFELRGQRTGRPTTQSTSFVVPKSGRLTPNRVGSTKTKFGSAEEAQAALDGLRAKNASSQIRRKRSSQG